MSLAKEIESLRDSLAKLAREPEARLLSDYALYSGPVVPTNLYRQFRMAIGRLLRRLHLRPTRNLEPWLPTLKHREFGEAAKPLLIWALDTDRETLRNACQRFEKLQAELPAYAPVLVTDVADFAFFSRLGWLVEYVPTLSEPANSFAQRKRRHLAWRYRDAPALPVSIGLMEDLEIGELMIE